MNPSQDDVRRGIRHLTKLLARDVFAYLRAVEAHLRDYGATDAFGGKLNVEIPQPGRRAEPKERR